MERGTASPVRAKAVRHPDLRDEAYRRHRRIDETSPRGRPGSCGWPLFALNDAEPSRRRSGSAATVCGSMHIGADGAVAANRSDFGQQTRHSVFSIRSLYDQTCSPTTPSESSAASYSGEIPFAHFRDVEADALLFPRARPEICAYACLRRDAGEGAGPPECASVRGAPPLSGA